ncbi:MAG: hypothetical protein JOY70_09550 [Acidisphaera sp.]|nr:hypothetical protein [Acidisphaera sp.]MBV9812663.1 hypothetical protein [Acetobacteraceae bacterium]
MVTRGDILLLGISAGVTGGMIGGVVLAYGILLITGGANLGWILLCVGAPLSGSVGWIMARRLAARAAL